MLHQYLNGDYGVVKTLEGSRILALCYFNKCIEKAAAIMIITRFPLCYIHKHSRNPMLAGILQEMIKFVLD